MAKHKEYYKGEGGGFSPSSGCGESCESMFTCGSSMHQKWRTPKSLDPIWVQVIQTIELFGTRGTLLALNIEKGRGAC
jgi:positive regulator of sigma E activity